MKKLLATISRMFPALFFCVLIACSNKDEPQTREPISYLALGDSYTIGEGVDETQAWPYQLKERLKENNFEVSNFSVIAQTGWRTGDLIDKLAVTKLAEHNLVSLLIGVNNQFWSQSFDIFKEEFGLLLNNSIAIAGGKENVFVVSIPDYGVTPFGSSNSERIARDIDMYNTYIQETCLSEGVIFINITEISRQLGDSPGSLAPDNLHPSGTQYGLWVEKILPEVLGILNP